MPAILHSILLLLHYSLGPLVVKVKEYQIETIVDTLCNNMLSEKEQLRDISRFVFNATVDTWGIKHIEAMCK